MRIIELLKVILFGLVEGYTEWLPISSTGHLILVEELVRLDQPESFWEMFLVVIQLGAILAVVVLYWSKLWPFGRKKPAVRKRETWTLWGKIILACIPAAVVGIPLDDFLSSYLHGPVIVALMLILYGVLFLWLERRNKGAEFPIRRLSDLSIVTAFQIGLFQCLSLIPGTSRSGSTILGAMLLGCARPVAAEFSFYLGIPVMCGASLIKTLKYLLSGGGFTGEQIVIVILGMAVSFVVALYTIRYLMSYIRKHDFTVFGWYRIVLGIVVLLFFAAEPVGTAFAAQDSAQAGYENGQQIGLDDAWQYADSAVIRDGKAVFYKAESNRKGKIVALNAGHGTSGGTSVKTWCHPDRTAKVTGGTTAAGATKAVAVSTGMSFKDGTPERTVTLRMAQILRDKLLAAGYDVLMLRDGEDVQLDNVARSVIANNTADCHIALHWDGDGLSTIKGCFYMSVPDKLKSMEPVASHWQEHERLGDALIAGLKAQGMKIWGSNPLDMDLTQTSYSTIPSVDIELGNQCSRHDDDLLSQEADGLLAGINAFFGF